MSKVLKVMTMDEIMERYKGCWVAIKVVERDANAQPVRGEVISHHGIRSMVMKAIYNEPDVCILRATSVPEEGYMAMF